MYMLFIVLIMGLDLTVGLLPRHSIQGPIPSEVSFCSELETKYLEKYFTQANIDALKQIPSSKVSISLGTLDLSPQRAEVHPIIFFLFLYIKKQTF